MSSDDGDDKSGDTDEAWQVLALVNDWLKHAEAKAGIALAAAGALGGLLYNLVGELTGRPWWIAVPTVASAVFIVGAGACGTIAVVPRLWRKEAPSSKIYYDHIARAYPKATKNSPGKLPAFQNVFAKTTVSKGALFDELSAQVWANAHVATTKYNWSTWAIVFVIAGAISAALTAIGVAWPSW